MKICSSARSDLAGEGIHRVDGADLIAEKLDAVGELLVGWMKFDHVAAHAERGPLEIHVVAGVLEIDQLAKHLVAVGLNAASNGQHRRLVIGRRAEAEDARNRRHQQHVASADEIAGGRETQAIQIVISAGVFLDVNIALGNVSLGLIVVVIADEIPDGIVGKELLEFLVKLCGQRFVMGDHQRGLVDAGDGVGHRKSLAGTGDAHERLKSRAGLDAGDKLFDGLGLISLGLKRTDHLKLAHGRIIAGSTMVA